ncbi:MAG: glycosyltransferase [Desulfobacterales bacterium]|nr:glycosyltransferase [Desulfobacterales bacterium]
MDNHKKRPVISIIIPTYNRDWIIRDAVNSVLSQNYNNFELIVVNDGSTDDTSDILDEYGDQINVIYQENRGVSAARNLGISKSSGQYVAFLDSDDTWLPDKLSCQIDFFRNNPAALICQTEEIWVRNGKRVNPKYKHQKLSGLIFESSLALCLVSPSAVMIDKKLFNMVGLFDESLPACEDYDLWLRTSYRIPIHLIDVPHIIKRGGHDDQLSSNPCLDRYRIQSIKNIIENHPLDGIQRLAAIEMLKKKCKIYANGCLKRGRDDEAKQYLDLKKTFS